MITERHWTPTGLTAAALLSAFSLALGAGSAGWADEHGHEGHDEHAAAPAVTMEGEIVDLQCFMGHPETSQGKDHIACAQACMNKGLPIGFLSGNQVYLLLAPGHDTVKAKVAKLAGVPVTLTGTVIEHHGMKAVQLKDVKRAGAGGAAAAPAKVAAKDVWVCPMGCEGKTYDKPGKCATCNMDLVKKKG